MKKNNKKFGIISGAGPMAGALLYQQVITILQANGSWRDADFPAILLMNVPFSEMLSGETDNPVVKKELLHSLNFISNQVDYVYIACQTLHTFLTPEEMIKNKVVSLLSLTKAALAKRNTVSVVASKTSRLSDLHSRHMGIECRYLEPDKAERAIEAILRGDTNKLIWLEALAKEEDILLGCTEFSVATQHSSGRFIDPIKLAANDIVKKMGSDVTQHLEFYLA